MCRIRYFFILNTYLILDFISGLATRERPVVRAETMIRTRDAAFEFQALGSKIFEKNLII